MSVVSNGKMAERSRFRAVVLRLAKKYEKEYGTKIGPKELVEEVKDHESEWHNCIKRFLEGKSFALDCVIADIDDVVEMVFQVKAFETEQE